MPNSSKFFSAPILGAEFFVDKSWYLCYNEFVIHATNLIADLKHTVLGAVSHEKYSYDAEGNISAIHEDGKLKVRFAYDNLNRLIREDNKALGITTVFAYDNGGNLLRQREYPFTLDAVENLDETNTFVYCYGNENRPDQLTSFNGQTISYDANGCPISYFGNACTFEYGTRMTKFGENTFSYDADGLRSTKNNVAYTYIDGKLIRQTGGAAGKIDFIYGASGMIGFEKDGTRYFYRRNLMGDVTHIYDENGTLFAEYVYDAWGNHQIKTDVNGIGAINPIRYRGYYYDTETGLYYLRARYYDPETGRFISQDDVSYLTPTHLSGLNLYAYCNDNPILYTDPSGCTAWWEWALAGTIVAGLIVGSIFTGGLLGAALVGAAIGAGISLGIQAIGDRQLNWGQFALDTMVGAASGLLAVSPISRIGSAIVGAGINGTANLISQTLINGNAVSNLDWVSFGISVVIGFAFGYMAGAGTQNVEGYGSSDAYQAAAMSMKRVQNRIASGTYYATERGMKSAITQAQNRMLNVTAEEMYNAFTNAMIMYGVSTFIGGVVDKIRAFIKQRRFA